MPETFPFWNAAIMRPLFSINLFWQRRRGAFRLAIANGPSIEQAKAKTWMLTDISSCAGTSAGKNRVRSCPELTDGKRAGRDNSHQYSCQQDFFHHGWFSFLDQFSLLVRAAVAGRPAGNCLRCQRGYSKSMALHRRTNSCRGSRRPRVLRRSFSIVGQTTRPPTWRLPASLQAKFFSYFPMLPSALKPEMRIQAPINSYRL
jgi:hypothetical protein